MSSAILGGFAALLMVSTAPGVAVVAVKPPTLEQLRAALIAPEDLGDAYVPNTKRNREALDSEAAGTQKCVRAMKALKPLLASKAAAFIDEDGEPAGVKQFVVSATPAKLASWEAVGKVMVRDCVGAKAGGDGPKRSTTKLSIGKFGDWTYGIRHRQTVTEKSLSPIYAADVVLIRVKSTVTLLVSDGFFAKFDPSLSKRAAKVAVSKLRNAQ